MFGIPEHITEPHAVLIMSVWAIVWGSFYSIGRKTVRSLSKDSRLVYYSGAVFGSITVFYELLFSGVGDLLSYVGTQSTIAHLLSLSMVRNAGIFLIIFGAVCMIMSRWRLRKLTLSEVLFALSPFQTKEGIYRYASHPMYLGMGCILSGSLLLYPNIFGAGVMVPILFFVYRKKRIEEENSKTTIS